MPQEVSFFLIGVLLGLIVRFPTFAFITIAAMLSYGALELTTTPTSAWIIHLLASLLALQVGYFTAVMLRFLRERRKVRK
jgi:hypothetical protein